MNKGDKIVILIILLISLGLFGLSKTFIKSKNEKYISVQVDGKEVKKYYFDPSIYGKEIPFETKYGKNTIIIEEDGVSMVESSCPDQICVHMRKITQVGEMIVCLPNKILIEIKGEDPDKGLDVIIS